MTKNVWCPFIVLVWRSSYSVMATLKHMTGSSWIKYHKPRELLQNFTTLGRGDLHSYLLKNVLAVTTCDALMFLFQLTKAHSYQLGWKGNNMISNTNSAVYNEYIESLLENNCESIFDGIMIILSVSERDWHVNLIYSSMIIACLFKMSFWIDAAWYSISVYFLSKGENANMYCDFLKYHHLLWNRGQLAYRCCA